MAIKIFLDDIDITADLAAQHSLPASADVNAVLPDKSRSSWWDLMEAISNHPELRDSFFNNDTGVHSFTIQDTSGKAVSARVLLRMKYTSRNR